MTLRRTEGDPDVYLLPLLPDGPYPYFFPFERSEGKWNSEPGGVFYFFSSTKIGEQTTFSQPFFDLSFSRNFSRKKEQGIRRTALSVPIFQRLKADEADQQKWKSRPRHA